MELIITVNGKDRKVGHFEVNSINYNGKDLVIDRIGAYDVDGEYIKWAKLAFLVDYIP